MLVGGGASDSMLSGGIDDPSVHTLILSAKAGSNVQGKASSSSSRAVGAAARAGEDDEDSDGHESVDDGGHDTPKKPTKTEPPTSKWWDMETSINKAERGFKKKVEKCKERMADMLDEMKSTIAQFRAASKSVENFSVELSVVVWRHSWLSCVLTGTESQLKDLMAAVHKGKSDNESVSERAASQDPNAPTNRKLSVLGRTRVPWISAPLLSGRRHCSFQAKLFHGFGLKV